MSISNHLLQSVPILVRYTARTVGLLLIVLVITIAIGEGLPNPSMLTARELTLMSAFFILVAGMALGFLKEGWGGLVTLAGYGLFWMANGLRSFGIMNAAGLVGTAYVFCWWCQLRMDRQSS